MGGWLGKRIVGLGVGVMGGEEGEEGGGGIGKSGGRRKPRYGRKCRVWVGGWVFGVVGLGVGSGRVGVGLGLRGVVGE
jgi:hypothetical protein